MAGANDKQAIQSWSDYLDNIRKSTAVISGETEDAKKKRISRLEKPGNEEEWFKFYFPKYCSAEPAAFHKRATRRVIDNPEWYEVRIWSRELAKSVRSMMEIFYLMFVGHPLYDENGKLIGRLKKKYLLFVSNSEDNAIRLLKPFRGNLEGNDRLINDYGNQKMPGQWTESEFITLTGLAFRGLGAGQSPLGTRNEEVRPDIIAFDDIETEEDTRNPEQLKKLWRWIEDAAIATRSISVKTLKIFCGNRRVLNGTMDKASAFAKNKNDLQYDIRDRFGKSTWPQKNTEEMIDIMLEEKSYASAQREYFNNPIQEGSVFKEMAYKASQPLHQYTMLVCYTDPSFKDTKKSDYKATVLVGKWRDEYHVIKAFVEQTTTAKMIEWHHEMMKIVGPLACYYFMEQNFLQDLILKEFYEAGQRLNITIPISGDDRVKPDKFTRIESLLEPLNRNGKLYLNEREKDNPHMKRLEEQFLALAPTSRAHDDGPDAVEGGVWKINQKLIALKPDAIQTFKKPVNPKRY